MKVSIVATNRCRVPVTVMPIGACRVAEAAAGAGHQVRVLDLMFARDPVRTMRRHLEEFRPDCVGFSVRNIDNGDLCDPVAYWRDLPDLVRTVRETIGAPVVLGGGAVSVMPEELLRLTGADLAVVGEGAGAIVRILSALERGEKPDSVRGTAWLQDGSLHLNPPGHDRPIRGPVAPDYHRWVDLNKYARLGAGAPVQTKRGCPRRCVYCTYPLLEGRCHRMADPGSVADAVERLGRSGIEEVEFVDNVFNDPPEHALRICREVARRAAGVRLYTTELSPPGLDGRLLRTMRAAGFCGFGLTVESACGEVLDGLGKDYGEEEVRRAARAVHGQDLPCLWMYMLGGPGETPDTVRRTLDFAERHCRPVDAVVFFPGIRVFPGTPLEQIAREEGRLQAGEVDFLQPVFYLSPDVEKDRLLRTVRARARRVPGFLAPASRTASFLPFAYRAGRWLGIRPPLWKHTSTLRRFLAPLGL